MNQKDTSMPTVSLSISCRTGDRQSSYELSHKHSPPPAHAGGAADAFCWACEDAAQLKAIKAPTTTVTMVRARVPRVLMMPCRMSVDLTYASAMPVSGAASRERGRAYSGL